MDLITSVDARNGAVVAEVASITGPRELTAICDKATAVSGLLQGLGRLGRARMLEAMADALEERRAEIVGLAERETALGATRLGGEMTRTTAQLRFFAEVVSEGSYLEATIDHARQGPAGPQPDMRRILQPLGPVAVFGASNFPLAFSVPGGDTASALAAGCPVIVKVHAAHPATSVACAEALAEGAARTKAAPEVVSLLFGDEAGVALIEHPSVRAVGFTGSLRGGRYLFDVANRRPSPVPFYGELGALNPVVVGPSAAAARAGEIASGLAASFTLGVGQFCTKPGLVFLPEGSGGDAVRHQLAVEVAAMGPGHMLSEQIAASYGSGSAALRQLDGMLTLAAAATVPGDAPGWWGTPVLLEATPDALQGAVAEECFGPVMVVVRYHDAQQLAALLARLHPALTGTVHADGPDEELLQPVLAHLAASSGRLVWNGYPTGLAVTWATHHGGPYPATTAPLHTSVGAAAIRRWLRPVAYQNFPDHLLPAELRDDPPAGSAVPRRVDGQLVLPPSS